MGETTSTTTNITSLPTYAQPYYKNMMDWAQAQTTKPYQPYGGERIAGYTDAQKQVQANVLGMQAPGQIATGSGISAAAGLGALNAANYTPGAFSAQQVGMPNLQQYRMQQPGQVQAGTYNAPQMGTAQTSYAPNLNYFQMQGPQSFVSGDTSQTYMNPYMQNVVDVQKQEAIRDAKMGNLAANLASARTGTYGGARQTLAESERERNLATQLGAIQASGLNTAYQQAQQQFNAEQAAQQGARQANLQAMLGVQQLGTQTGLQSALANLDAASQANVQNLAAKLQTQGLNADQALRAALANQQSELTVGQQNLGAALQTQQLGTETGLRALLANQQADLEAQRLAEQSNQFGAQNALEAFGLANQTGQTLGNLGQAQQQSDLARLQAQMNAAGMDQAMQQQYLDQFYQDFQNQRDYEQNRYILMSQMLSGLPISPSSMTTTTAPSPSTLSQIAGAGLGAAGVYNMFRGG